MSKTLLKIMVTLVVVVIGCCAFNYAVNEATAYMSGVSQQMTSMFKAYK